MSYEEYNSLLPGQFPRPKKDRQNEDTLPREKGFADIIEYHSQGLAGPNKEIYETKKFILEDEKGKKKKAATYEDYAIVLRRTWMKYKNTSLLVRVELEIQSNSLCVALRNIMKSVYEKTDLDNFPMKLQSPFSELFFYRKEIQSLSESEDNDPDVRRDAKVLHDFIQSNGLLSSIIQDHEKYSQHDQVVNDILWTIFPPNSLLLLTIGLIQECWICRNVTIKYVPELGEFWVITGLRVDFDGVSPGLTRQTFTLPYSGMQVCKISELPLIPLRRAENLEAVKEMMIQRSQKLAKILGKDLSSFRSQSYQGNAWDQNYNDYTPASGKYTHKEQVDERIIVDFKEYLSDKSSVTLENIRRGPHKIKPRKKARGFVSEKDNKRKRRAFWSHSDDEGEFNDDVDPEHDRDLLDFRPAAERSNNESATPEMDTLSGISKAVSDIYCIPEIDFELLFPALVPAFCLQSKKWRWVLSDKLNDLNWNYAAFESLRLNPRTKLLIEALVKGHKARSIDFEDVVPGKGQGLIFLLHGKPGLGKTLTAESVADYLERPLYSISGGELSTRVTQLEERLNLIFKLTKRWNAVTLLDEADVLLGKRNSAEVDRNAIVAVFLRKIEYFQGVLFLTTNRKDDFDDAFKSRIHVTITYPDLSADSQSEIWKALVKKNSISVHESWTDDIYSILGKLQLNGRTIKNILRTAVAYAHADKKDVEPQHVLAMVVTELAADDSASTPLSAQEDEARKNVQEALESLEELVEQQKKPNETDMEMKRSGRSML
ncbi:P-loop containing nucleoside triphosphate hydrolase protein [Trichoderma austrokoningii]